MISNQIPDRNITVICPPVPDFLITTDGRKIDVGLLTEEEASLVGQSMKCALIAKAKARAANGATA